MRELDLNTKEPEERISAIQDTSLGFIPAGSKPFVKYRFTQPNSNDNVDSAPPLSVLKAQWQDHLHAQIISYDSMSHQFSIMGDMFLNPGRTVNLQFPKTLDPAANTKSLGIDRFDKRLSKDYLVFQAVHTFQEGKHTTDVTVKSNDN